MILTFAGPSFNVVLRASGLKVTNAQAEGRATKTATTKNKQCKIVVFPQESNLQPLDYRSTTLSLELEKTYA